MNCCYGSRNLDWPHIFLYSDCFWHRRIPHPHFVWRFRNADVFIYLTYVAYIWILLSVHFCKQQSLTLHVTTIFDIISCVYLVVYLEYAFPFFSIFCYLYPFSAVVPLLVISIYFNIELFKFATRFYYDNISHTMWLWTPY